MRLATGELVEHQMVRLLLERINLGESQKQIASELGIAPQYLNDILRGWRGISAEIADRMGYVRTVCYLPKPLEVEG